MESGIGELLNMMDKLYRDAYFLIVPRVIEACFSKKASEEQVAGLFEEMLNYVYHKDFEMAYRLLAQTYAERYPVMVVEYIYAFKELTEEGNDEDDNNSDNE